MPKIADDPIITENPNAARAFAEKFAARPKIVGLPVCGPDLADLRKSGLSDATIRANGLRTENAALVIPYRDLDGSVNCFARRRPHDGKPAKYVQPPGSPLRAYFPVASLVKLRDGKSPVYITEGEKKALALSQLGLAAIGLGGFYGGLYDDALIDDLAAIPWRGRTIYVVFDRDPKVGTRINASVAKRRLAQALLAAEAGRVLDVQLPAGPGNEKMGVDDYLKIHGAVEFGRLLGEAVNVIDAEEDGEPSLSIVKIVSIAEPQLGQAALVGLAGEFVRTVEPHTEATAPCLLAHFLTAAAAMMRGPRVAGTGEPARISSLMVGETSEGRKGTGWRQVDRLMKLAVPDWWREQKSTGLSSGEGLVARLEDVVTKDPETGEAMMITPTDKRLFVVEEEFASVLAHMKREGNILSHIIRCAFDGGDLETLTIKRRVAPGTHICIAAHCTPDELRHKLGYIEQVNGFVNRFLLWAAHSTKVLSRPKPIPDSALAPLARKVAGIFKVAGEDRCVALSTDAQALWDEVYPGLRSTTPELVGAMTARRAPYALRLALVYWGLEIPRLPAIGRRHLEAALAVIDYCGQSTEAVFGGRTGAPLMDRVIALLKQRPMTKAELNKHFSNEQKKELPDLLVKMEAQGLIAREVRRTNGRPATVYILKDQ